MSYITFLESMVWLMLGLSVHFVWTIIKLRAELRNANTDREYWFNRYLRTEAKLDDVEAAIAACREGVSEDP